MLEPITKCVDWADNACVLLDQTRLPSIEVTRNCGTYQEVVDAIKVLAVRGAPAIGVAGAYAVVLAHREASSQSALSSADFFQKALGEIKSARPTAVNLAWAVEIMKDLWNGEFTESSNAQLLREASRIHSEDVAANGAMAKYGSELFGVKERILTHCNTGDLATGGIGTAFGVIHECHRQGKVEQVFACEARPLLQGLRLTAWELEKAKIPFRVICDSMAGAIIRREKITGVILGADRIASNGDVANKIGTYSLAVLAKHHGIPFYVAAPSSTFDLTLKSGDEIPIEERDAKEIFSILGDNQPAKPFPVANPAFDVTPAELITAIVCEKGVITQPTVERVAGVLR